MLVGKYNLQSHHNKYYDTDSPCPACGDRDETLIHMLLSCGKYSDARHQALNKIARLVELDSGPDAWRAIQSDRRMLLRAVLDTHSPQLSISPDCRAAVSSVAREYIYTAHCIRSAVVQQSSKSQ